METTPEKHTSTGICYELSGKSIEQLVSLKEAVDGKSLALLGGASALITFVPALAKAWFDKPLEIRNIPFALAIIFFGFAAFFLLRAYWPKAMMSTYDPKILLDNYAYLEPEQCQLQLLSHFASNYARNYNILSDVSGDVKWGFRFVIAETSFLFIRLLSG